MQKQKLKNHSKSETELQMLYKKNYLTQRFENTFK